jgi:aldose sugar dehydrogenase
MSTTLEMLRRPANRRITRSHASRILAACRMATLYAGLGLGLPAAADSIPTQILDPELEVTTYVGTGLSQPIGIVFMGPDDALVLEKASGQVKRVIGGTVLTQPVLDLAVNSASERGLLSAALHPDFPVTPFVYLSWTESSTGEDTNVTSNVPLLGNRIDRFLWNGSTLTFDQNIVRLRARQTDNVPVPGHPGTNNANEQGNHNGGVIRFGPDGKLYVFVGDVGRRGQLQNLTNGPFLTPPFVDDTFGGPQPDTAHLTGVILRLNDDGSTPVDNPFFVAGMAVGGEAGANIQKIFSYGHRNGFGMAFDPVSGSLWETENGDDAFSEVNRVVPGMNGGWVQIAGPLSRFAQFRSIETLMFGGSLQQVRYPPTRLAYTAGLAQSRMFMLPGATYVDPSFSWKFEVAPAGTAFVAGTALGAEYDGTLWIGSARSFAQVGGTGGSLYRFRLTSDRLHVDVSSDPRLADRVADNLGKFEATESETLLIGRGFGTTPSIEQGPDGNLYVVSLTDNVIYRVSRRP